MNHYLTPDLCDAYPELVQVLNRCSAISAAAIPSAAKS